MNVMANPSFSSQIGPRGRSHYGVFIGPPVIFIPPSLVRYHIYYPPYDYYGRDYRVWVPGHWEYRLNKETQTI